MRIVRVMNTATKRYTGQIVPIAGSSRYAVRWDEAPAGAWGCGYLDELGECVGYVVHMPYELAACAQAFAIAAAAGEADFQSIAHLDLVLEHGVERMREIGTEAAEAIAEGRVNDAQRIVDYAKAAQTVIDRAAATKSAIVNGEV